MTFHNREHAFACDTCPESIDTEDREFSEAREYITSKGWRTYKGPDKQFAHACLACVADFARQGSR